MVARGLWTRRGAPLAIRVIEFNFGAHSYRTVISALVPLRGRKGAKAMRKLFGAVLMASALSSGSAWATCAHTEDQMMTTDRAAMQRAVLVAAMSCGNVALGTHAVFYRSGEPQQADAALLAFVLLLQAQQADDQHKKPSQ